ncbi:hypothetical protein GALL_409720 [mine drainage metagenome]|uniref:Uncharacterized protein n=1 Tax=mine drainage metagenome TaxID=410659 RepID=A0A1J5Q0U6_9ZZZZ
MLALGTFERIQIGPAGTDVAVSGNQLLNRNALTPQIGVGTGGHHHSAAALLCALGKRINHGLMGHITGIAAIHCANVLQRIEIIAPGVRHAARIGQVVFVHLFNVRGVTAKQMGIGLIGLVNRRGWTHVALTFISLGEI